MVSWEQALDIASARLQAIIDTYGPQAVAIYASGQLLTELLRRQQADERHIGAANIDTNSRLCMSSCGGGLQARLREDIIVQLRGS